MWESKKKFVCVYMCIQALGITSSWYRSYFFLLMFRISMMKVGRNVAAKICAWKLPSRLASVGDLQNSKLTTCRTLPIAIHFADLNRLHPLYHYQDKLLCMLQQEKVKWSLRRFAFVKKNFLYLKENETAFKWLLTLFGNGWLEISSLILFYSYRSR